MSELLSINETKERQWRAEQTASSRDEYKAPSCPQRVIYYGGDRIYFSPIEPEDEPLLRRWINDPRSWRTLGQHSPTNSLREQEWIRKLNSDPTERVLGIVTRDEHRLIGSTGLSRISPVNHGAELGIFIGDVDARRKGYGREAVRLLLRYGFEELNLQRIQLGVLGSNWWAIRTYQKIGFVYEGCSRDHIFRAGGYEDVYRFALLKDEWLALQGRAVCEDLV